MWFWLVREGKGMYFSYDGGIELRRNLVVFWRKRRRVFLFWLEEGKWGGYRGIWLVIECFEIRLEDKVLISKEGGVIEVLYWVKCMMKWVLGMFVYWDDVFCGGKSRERIDRIIIIVIVDKYLWVLGNIFIVNFNSGWCI